MKKIWIAAFLVGITTSLAGNAFAQRQAAQPAEVPDVVKIQRPTPEEIETAKAALSKFKEDVDPKTKEILEKFPDLLAVRPPAPNSATIPNLAGFFRQKHQANVEVAKKGEAELLFMGALEAVLDANGRMASDAVRQLLGPDDHLRIDYDFPEGVPDLDDARLETLDQLSRQALATWHRRRGEIVDWVTGAR